MKYIIFFHLLLILPYFDTLGRPPLFLLPIRSDRQPHLPLRSSARPGLQRHHRHSGYLMLTMGLLLSSSLSFFRLLFTLICHNMLVFLYFFRGVLLVVLVLSLFNFSLPFYAFPPSPSPLSPSPSCSY
jgi:hypothetical protein